MAVIGGATYGFGFRADDHGDTASTATPLAYDGLYFSGAGIIGTNEDVNVWSFKLSENRTVRLTLDPAAVGPNLDAVLELRDSSGQLVASDSPATAKGRRSLLVSGRDVFAQSFEGRCVRLGRPVYAQRHQRRAQSCA